MNASSVAWRVAGSVRRRRGSLFRGSGQNVSNRVLALPARNENSQRSEDRWPLYLPGPCRRHVPAVGMEVATTHPPSACIRTRPCSHTVRHSHALASRS